MICKKGDFIGNYEVYDVLGEGGFGIVYLVYSQKTESVYALKTLRDEYLEDTQTRNRFRKEAEVWIKLDRHPYLVRAYFVDEISGRLYIAMEHIAPDEHGSNSLDGYLKRRPPDLAQSLRWAIQFCYGMEYAYSKGIRAHRDIKPSNIMIDQNKTVTISDFGLAGIFQQESIISQQGISSTQIKNDASMQTIVGTSIGTPEYMAPEQFTDFSVCDERSDIYSFGIVLFQMASRGKLPFNADNPDYRWTALKHLHHEAPVPNLNSPLFPIIQRCLEKEPSKRIQTFRDLRVNLEILLKRETGEIVSPPELEDLEIWEWINKGTSLRSLGKDQEAIACYDKALEIEPRNAIAWLFRGNAFLALNEYKETIICNNKVLDIEPRNAIAWKIKGDALQKLGKTQEAIACYNKALEIKPTDADAWYSKGIALQKLGKIHEAIACYGKALEMDPGNAYIAFIWYGKAYAEDELRQRQDAIHSYKRFLELATTEQYKEQIEYARQRLKELEGR